MRAWKNLLALILAAPAVVAGLETHPPAGSPSEYRDPGNRFSLMVPSGWKVRALGDSVQVVRGDSYVSVIVYPHSTDAHGLIGQLQTQIGKKWKRFERLRVGSSQLGGLPAEAAWFSGVNAEGQESLLKLECAISGSTGYVLVSGFPKSEAAKVQHTLDQIERSFTFLSAAAEAAKSPPSATLGMEVADLGPEDAPIYHLKEASGALVVQLADGGPAQQAGVELHDVVVSANGQSIDSAATLQQVVSSNKPGDVLEVQIVRVDGESKVSQKMVRITLAADNRP